MDIKKQEDIRKQAKSILDNFSRALDKVKVKNGSSKFGVVGFRIEGSGKTCDLDFRERMFANAPHTDGDCIIAETKQW